MLKLLIWQEVQQDKLVWNRLELKSRDVQRNVTSFEKEIERVDRLFMKNSLAMVNLTSIQEDLLNLYLSEDIRAHKKKRKLSAYPKTDRLASNTPAVK